MRITARKAIVTIAVVLVLAALAWTAWNFQSTQKLETALLELRAAGIPTTPEELSPAPLPPDQNAAHYYEAAFAIAARIPEESHEKDLAEIPEVPGAVRDALPRFAEALDLTHRAAGLPRCQFRVRYQDGFAAELRHIHPLRRLARLLAARSIVRSESGDVEGALKDLEALFALGRALSEEPILISQLVRIAIARHGFTALRAVLPRCPDAAEAVRRVRPDSARGGVAAGLRGEIAMAATLIDPEILEGVTEGVPDIPTGLSGPLTRPRFKSELAYHLRIMHRFLKVLDRAYPEAFEDGRRLETEMEARGGALTAFLFPATLSALKKEAETAALSELARLAAAMLDHRRRHGAFPASLAELKDIEPVLDPLTGRAFVLRREGGAAVLAAPGDGGPSWRLEEGR